jgi:ribosomal protein L13E
MKIDWLLGLTPTEVGAVTSTKSAPTKPKSKPSPASTKKSPTPKAAKGKEKVILKGKEKVVSDGKEKKNVKTKFIPIPLVHPDDRENFEKYWKIKPVPTGRIFDFEELEKKGMDIRKYVEPLGWTDFFKIKDSVLPQLVQAFYHNANVHSDKNLIISNIRGVEIQLDTETLGCLINLPFEGVTIYGGDWYSKLGVSKEALIMELFNEE